MSVTGRALIVALLLTGVCGLWTMPAEIIVCATQITESVPALPAVAMLILLVLVNPFLQRLGPRFGLRRGEIYLIYAFLVIATTLPGCGIARFFLALLSSLFYFDTPENQFAKLQEVIPKWLIPHDKEVIRQMWEAVEAGERIPWEAWLVPLSAWLGFFVLFWLLLLSIMVILRRQWVDRERLAFPLLQLPLEMAPAQGADGLTSGQPLLAAFFCNPIMWIGFGLSTLYNLLNILQAFNPAFVAPGKFFNLGSLFTERPLNAVQPMVLHYRPEMVGFGYLVSTEISFSIWVFYLFVKLQSILCSLAGYETAGRPFPQEQSIGAYLAFALFLLWLGRGQLIQVWRKAALFARDVEDRDEALPYRWAVLGVVVGLAGTVFFCQRAGMLWWAALLYLLIVAAVALVYARIRAEAGIPLIWMFPFYQQKKVLLYTLGSAPFMPQGQLGTMTVFALLTFLSRGYIPSLMGYQIENYKLADEGHVRLRSMTWMMTWGLILGMVVAWAIHLWPYYRYGAGVLRQGIWGYEMANSEYKDVITFSTSPMLRDKDRIIATAGGFGLTALLMVLRMVFLRFPLHPIGYCAATSYGDLVWWSFFLVWLIKTVVFHLGGVRLYRRLIPGFIGFALGHFFTAGIVWGIWSTLGGVLGRDEVFQRYGVWFG